MNYKAIPILPLAMSAFCLLSACHTNDPTYDATGIIEADEVVVSAEVNGKLLEYIIQEGSEVPADSIIGKIDPAQYALQSQQVQQTIESINQKTMPVQPQLDILSAQEKTQKEQLKSLNIQLESLLKEKNRISKLFQAKAATQKQLDDVNSQYDFLNQQIEISKSQIQMTRQQMESYKATMARQNASILSEKDVFDVRKEASDDLLKKANIQNPVSGTVLSNYVHAGEWVHTGKPLYKIADLKTVFLRTYIDGSQLLKVQLNQEAKVVVRYGDSQREYTGIVVWISDKSEFTPKTIQTADERAHLVYAAKIRIQNDGYLKLGMYGEVKFN